MFKGSTIKKAREEAGECQIDFAKRLGVHQTTLSRWETGIIPVPKPIQKLFAEVVRKELEMEAAQ